MVINTPYFMAAMLIVTAVAAIAATVTVAKRGAGWRVLSVLLVIVTSLMLLSSYLVRTNVITGWVRTMDDLVEALEGGMDDVVPGPITVSPQDGIPEDRATPTDFALAGISDVDRYALGLPADTAPTPAAAFTDLRQQAPQEWKGELEGQASGLASEATIWAPAGLDPTDPNAEFSVIVFMHGQPGGDDGVIESLELHKRLTGLMADGTLAPSIVVIPDVSTEGKEPNCVDIEGSRKVETFIAKDIVQAVRSTFPAAPDKLGDWTLAGISAGAYCAPMMSLRHADTYWGAISMGGYDNPLLGRLTEVTPEIQERYTLSHMLTEPGRAPAHIFINGGNGDEDAVAFGETASAAATATDEIRVDTSMPGGHTWTIWSEKLPGMIHWWQNSTGQFSGDQAKAGEDLLVSDPTPPSAMQRFLALDDGPWAITGTYTIALWSIAGLALLALTLRTAPAMKARGAKWIPARFAMVLVTAAVVFVVAFMLENLWSDDFLSWWELWQNRNVLI